MDVCAENVRFGSKADITPSGKFDANFGRKNATRDRLFRIKPGQFVPNVPNGMEAVNSNNGGGNQLPPDLTASVPFIRPICPICPSINALSKSPWSTSAVTRS